MKFLSIIVIIFISGCTAKSQLSSEPNEVWTPVNTAIGVNNELVQK